MIRWSALASRTERPEWKTSTLRVKWPLSTKIIPRKSWRAPKNSVRRLTKSSTISRTRGHSGLAKEGPQTTKFSQERISDSTKHHLDLTTTKCSTDRVWSLTFQVLASTNKACTMTSIIHPSQRIKCVQPLLPGPVPSSSLGRKRLKITWQFSIAKSSASNSRDCSRTFTSTEQTRKWVRVPTATSRTRWWRRASTWVWSIATLCDKLNSWSAAFRLLQT